MAEPVVKCYEEGDVVELTTLNPIDLGIVDAGDTGDPVQVNIWNNKGGSSDVSKMENVRLTTVTKNGYNSGDTIANGKDAVEQRYVGVKSLTNEDENYTQVGGATTKVLGDIRGDLLVAPGKPTGVVGHASGGKVRPGTYYGVIAAVDETGETLKGTESDAVVVSPMLEQTTEDTDSETLDTTTNTRLSQKFVASQDYINGVVFKEKTGGTLVGTIRVETDNAGNPSGTLAHASLEITGVTLTANALNYIFFAAQGTVTIGTTYHIVFIVTGGSGILRGTTTGTANQAKYYDGSWHDSAIENMVYKIISNNQITWTWSAVTNAQSYKVFRTISRGSYGASSLVGSPVAATLVDVIETPTTGQPKGTATVTRGHKHEVDMVLVVPTNAQSGAVDMNTRVLYQFQ
ncbi:MAG: hypothetical protein AMQ22_01279 [Candidatus Methanofastidiosum methylothiophilum]|uniref:Uncharacterized protein n=1 Tax=Candidatus Methanofastidiosum methylothiophilum TaxID=1705564 RepID=A0A150J361_9EURY|nr:MAG: hypothetical protein AMQ22_01279 [Candidatus Methanofastidiosum methylthiophilus]